MAKFTPVIGTFSGQIGSQIYAYNKGGFYTRTKVKQNFRNSQAQSDATATLISTRDFWNSLTDGQRAAWGDYANTYYKPLKPKKGIMYSGQQACIALFCSVSSANRMKRRVYIDNDTVYLSYDTYDFAYSYDPPNWKINNMILDTLGNSMQMNVLECYLTDSLQLNFTVQLDREITTAPVFQNPNTNVLCGVQLYISNSISASAMFFRKPYYFCIASSGLVNFYTDIIYPAWDILTFGFPLTDINLSNYYRTPQVGAKVRLSGFLIDLYGQKTLIGSNDVIVA